MYRISLSSDLLWPQHKERFLSIRFFFLFLLLSPSLLILLHTHTLCLSLYIFLFSFPFLSSTPFSLSLSLLCLLNMSLHFQVSVLTSDRLVYWLCPPLQLIPLRAFVSTVPLSVYFLGHDRASPVRAVTL